MTFLSFKYIVIDGSIIQCNTANVRLDRIGHLTEVIQNEPMVYKNH
jgi:hypothetical protein